MSASPPPQWLSIEVVARTYGVEVEWILRVQSLGVLRRAEADAGRLRIAVSELDRLAQLIRWYRLGVDLELAVALLADDPRADDPLADD
ncbi:MAG: hypothetical protein R3F56_06790 [Planctomycetota bacterium]